MQAKTNEASLNRPKTTTAYAGIDYGMGKANIGESGIRFGLIGQNNENLNQDAVQDVWQNGRDLGFEQFQADARAKLRSALSDYFSDTLDFAVEDAFDAVSDGIGDCYEGGESGPMLYEGDGYSIKTSETELWVLKSPFYTHAQFCSPCAPGAGNLDSPCVDGPKTYCLGHDWFENEAHGTMPIAPYPVYSVATGELVHP